MPLQGFLGSVAAVKEAVAIEDVAAEYTELRSTGGPANHYVGRCPLPDHEDKTPSFHVYADAEDQRWWCFGCSSGGDVLDLEQLAGQPTAIVTAMVALSARYGVELPERPEGWHEAQGRKSKMLDMIYASRGETLQGRVFRWVILPDLQEVPDLAERKSEIDHAWESWWESANRSKFRALAQARMEKTLNEATDEVIFDLFAAFCESRRVS